MTTKLLGNVDLLGLNQFGENPGMNPLYGVLIGGGVAGGTSLLLSRGAPTSTATQNADLIGFLVGLASGGALYAMKSTRHAAFGALAGAFLASGLKWLEGALFGPSAPAGAPVSGRGRGMGLPQINALNGGFGLPQISALNGGFGLPTATNLPQSQGTIPGVAGPQVSGFGAARGGGARPPVNLLGQQLAAGGPNISGLSARYGATLYGQHH
jgi:hypothetical protein